MRYHHGKGSKQASADNEFWLGVGCVYVCARVSMRCMKDNVLNFSNWERGARIIMQSKGRKKMQSSQSSNAYHHLSNLILVSHTVHSFVGSEMSDVPVTSVTSVTHSFMPVIMSDRKARLKMSASLVWLILALHLLTHCMLSSFLHFGLLHTFAIDGKRDVWFSERFMGISTSFIILDVLIDLSLLLYL